MDGVKALARVGMHQPGWNEPNDGSVCSAYGVRHLAPGTPIPLPNEFGYFEQRLHVDRRSLPLYRSLLFRVSPYQRGNIKKLLDLLLFCAPITLLNGSLFSLVGQFQIVEEDPAGAL
jgi:hypothetical protein